MNHHVNRPTTCIQYLEFIKQYQIVEMYESAVRGWYTIHLYWQQNRRVYLRKFQINEERLEAPFLLSQLEKKGTTAILDILTLYT